LEEMIKDLGIIAVEVVTLMAITSIVCKVIGEVFETAREWVRTRESK